jgi:hypothetical protein
VFEPPQVHPLGMNVAPAQVTYSAENSNRAVDLLMSLLERCRDKPKPATSSGRRTCVAPSTSWSVTGSGRVAQPTCWRPQLSSSPMNVQQVNTVGGIFELVGVVLAFRDLLELHRYRGDLHRLVQRLARVRADVGRRFERLLGRPVARRTVAGAGVAGARAQAMAAGVALHPFQLDIRQPIEVQIAALGDAINQLRQEVHDEVVNRTAAIKAERQRSRQELEAEAKRLRDAIGNVDSELQRLEELATGDPRLRRDGILVLLAGIILTTWPTWWSQHALGWLTWPVFVVLVAYFIAWRLVWAILVALRDG